ncbi:MAG: branched-chain amino acid ABC transporter permease [Chloroflexota bacterium]
MPPTLVIAQILNGVQLGLMLFLLASGLTLIFGIMDMVNLAHGSLYMFGAYFTASVTSASGSFWVGLLAGAIGTAILAAILEITIMRKLYRRDHLSQVLATFAIILISNEVVRLLWGAQPVLLNTPEASASGDIPASAYQRASSRFSVGFSVYHEAALTLNPSAEVLCVMSSGAAFAREATSVVHRLSSPAARCHRAPCQRVKLAPAAPVAATRLSSVSAIAFVGFATEAALRSVALNSDCALAPACISTLPDLSPVNQLYGIIPHSLPRCIEQDNFVMRAL